MSSERLFLDNAFIQALLNPRDDYHNSAKQLFPRVRAASEVWVTEAIFAEVGNALSAFNRQGAAQFIQQCYRTENIRVVTVDTALLMQALSLYQSRVDKTWGLIPNTSVNDTDAEPPPSPQFWGSRAVQSPPELGFRGPGFVSFPNRFGITDCIFFVVMRQQNLIEAVTADRHFVQGGFRALMLDVSWAG